MLVGRTPAIVLVPQAARTTIANPQTASASTTSEKIKTKLTILCGFKRSLRSPPRPVPAGVRACPGWRAARAPLGRRVCYIYPYRRHNRTDQQNHLSHTAYLYPVPVRFLASSIASGMSIGQEADRAQAVTPVRA